MQDNLVWHQQQVDKQAHSLQKKQKPCVLWFTGLSGSGKSTIANQLEMALLNLGKHSYLLDGDNVRHGLCSDLGFSDEDRVENIRRVSELSKLFADAGLIVLTAFISPFTEERAQARKLLEEGEFIEVFIDTDITVCEQRDPKGLYKKARAGELNNFTGIDSDYQPPLNPEIHIKTAEQSVEQAVVSIVEYLAKQGYLNA